MAACATIVMCVHAGCVQRAIVNMRHRVTVSSVATLATQLHDSFPSGKQGIMVVLSARFFLAKMASFKRYGYSLDVAFY